MIGPNWSNRRFELFDEIQTKLQGVHWISDSEYKENKVRRLEDAKAVRLDFPISAETLDNLDFPYWQTPNSNGFLRNKVIPDIVKQILVKQFTKDFVELVIDGDTNSTDPLLKILDGEKKLGVPFLGVDFGPVLWYAEYRVALDLYQITCYTTIRTIK